MNITTCSMTCSPAGFRFLTEPSVLNHRRLVENWIRSFSAHHVNESISAFRGQLRRSPARWTPNPVHSDVWGADLVSRAVPLTCRILPVAKSVGIHEITDFFGCVRARNYVTYRQHCRSRDDAIGQGCPERQRRLLINPANQPEIDPLKGPSRDDLDRG